MNSELSPKAIAAWHRKEAKQYEQLAKLHNDVAEKMELALNGQAITRYKRTEPVSLPPGVVISSQMLEDTVRQKSGRINTIAARLNTSETLIEMLLKDPASKVFVAERGWLKIRE